NGFRYFFNAYMSAAALAPVLKQMYGGERKFYMLTADYTWGWTQAASMKQFMEGEGWSMVTDVRTPLASTDFSSYLAPVLSSGADVLILNHYGGNMVNSLTQAVQFGMRDKMVNGKQFEIVVPLISELMAKGAGKNIAGIPGSSNWNWKLPDAGTKAFVQSYGKEYGVPPSQAAQTCYVQTILYADAVTRAKSFNPCAVVEALEGFKFDGMGVGPTVYRKDDHQAFKDVLVVQGNEKPDNEYDLLNVKQITPVEKVMYEPESEFFKGGNLGQCNPGA
ncbi:MAG: ABC transporter substrate-binding protein, partial [Paracoccaceae bacterium]|nr:ABC transporter substrate-binding protein [Paracoccaceae bacterium]